MFRFKYNNQAFSLVEVIVALGVFAILAAGIFNVATNNYRNFYGTGDKQAIAEFAQEGIEATRAIRDNFWQDIENVSGNGNQGIVKAASGYWEFNSGSDTSGALTRTVAVVDVERDANNEIVASGGTVDPNTKKVIVTVSGSGINDYVLTTYLTNWGYKTWEQSDWSGVGDREFWSDMTMTSSSYSNISTSTVGQVNLSQATGVEMSWSSLADLVPDSTVKYSSGKDVYNYHLGADGKSLYIVGKTNIGLRKYDISRAAAGIFSLEFKIPLPWYTQVVAFSPDYNYAYIAKRWPSDGTNVVCSVKISDLTVDTATNCVSIDYVQAYYANSLIVNAAGDALYMFNSYGYGYAFAISNGGATLTTTNSGQSINPGAINQAYLDESGAEPYILLVTDDNAGEFRKLGITDKHWFSSTSTNAYVDSSFTYDITDIEFLETSAGKHRFILGSENTSKEFQIVEDQGTSLTEIGSYDVATSQNYPEVTSDRQNMAFLHYYDPGGVYAIDITDRANPVDGSMSNTSMNRRSNYVSYDQMLYSTSSNGLFIHDHLVDNTMQLHFIGHDFTRATGDTFDYKRTITLGENSKVSGGPHLNFPVVISETQDYLKTVSNGGKVQNDNGYDIIFTSDATGNTILDHEIETYSSSTGEFVAWVKITPSLTANTNIYMFYGNSNISTTQENISGVWSNNYQLVSHMDDSGIEGVRPSVHSSNGWLKYATSSPSESSGVMGKAQYFDEDYDYLTVENQPDKAQGTGDFTIEVWVKPDSTATDTYSAILYFGNGDANDADGWILRRYLSTKKVYFHMGDDNVTNLGGMYIDTASIADDIWSYLAITVDRDVGYQAYINTVAKASYATNTTAYNIGDVYDVFIGKDWSSTNYFWKGDIDEVRISSDLKSADWMTTGYNNMISTSTFYTIGSEATAGGYNTPGILYSSILDLGSTDKELRSITVEQNIPSGCSLQITAEVSDDASFPAASIISEVYDDVSSSYYTSSTSATLNGKRYLRYKADMIACNSNADTPILYGAKFNYR